LEELGDHLLGLFSRVDQVLENIPLPEPARDDQLFGRVEVGRIRVGR